MAKKPAPAAVQSTETVPNFGVPTVTENPTKAPAKIAVTMADGRVVEFGSKARVQRTSLLVNGEPAIQFDFANGQTRTWTIPAGLLIAFAQLGAGTKIAQAAGTAESIDDVIEAMDAAMARLSAGTMEAWNAVREGGDTAGASDLVKALVKVTGQTVDVIRPYLETLSRKQRLALRMSPEIKPTIDALEAARAERAGKRVSGVNAADVLAGLTKATAPNV